MAKKVLWVSHHHMKEDQIADLTRIFGAVRIIKHEGSVKDAAEVVGLGNECKADILAVVLPPVIMSDLVNLSDNEKPVIRAVSNRVPTGKTVRNPATGTLEQEFRFEHAGRERILKIEIITGKL